MALNYPISADTKADMLSVVLPDGWVYLLMGASARGDQPPVFYQFNSASTATDDGNNVMTPTALIGSPGRYLKTKLSYNDLVNMLSLATVATSGAYTDLSGLPAAPVYNTPSRTLNSSAYQVSTTRASRVNYSIQIAATISLTSGQTGTVQLQICATSGGTYTTIATVTNGNTGSLTIGLNLTNTQTISLVGDIPLGYFVKLVSTGTATNSITSQQEVLL